MAEKFPKTYFNAEQWEDVREDLYTNAPGAVIGADAPTVVRQLISFLGNEVRVITGQEMEINSPVGRETLAQLWNVVRQETVVQGLESQLRAIMTTDPSVQPTELVVIAGENLNYAAQQGFFEPLEVILLEVILVGLPEEA